MWEHVQSLVLFLVADQNSGILPNMPEMVALGRLRREDQKFQNGQVVQQRPVLKVVASGSECGYWWQTLLLRPWTSHHWLDREECATHFYYSPVSWSHRWPLSSQLLITFSWDLEEKCHSDTQTFMNGQVDCCLVSADAKIQLVVRRICLNCQPSASRDQA